jgi:predicted AAA+ superfamily ATPase
MHYWHREERTSTAEVDYVIQVGSQIVPIEVKAGKTGRLKSIQIFLDEKKLPLGVRISQRPLELEKNILSVPFYLISNLSKLVGN